MALVAIGLAIAHEFAARGHPIQLVLRMPHRRTQSKDLEIRHGVSVTLHEFDALRTERHEEVIEKLPEPLIRRLSCRPLGDQSDAEN